MTIEKTHVSIIISNYNYASYIVEAVSSAVNQTHPHCEVIVMDDCSSDGSVRLLQETFGERIKLVKNEKNLGQGATINRAMKICNGKYLMFLDGDDVLERDAVLTLLKMSEGMDVVFGYYNSFYDEDKTPSVRHQNINSEVLALSKKFDALKMAQMMSRGNKLMRTEFLLRNNVRSSEYRVMNDALFALTLAMARPRCVFSSEVVANIRHHPNSISRKDSSEKIAEVIKVTNELIEESRKYRLYERLKLDGNNLVYSILINDGMFETVKDLRYKLTPYARAIVALKIFIKTRSPKYLKLCI